MIYELLIYYWQILKYGKPTPPIEKNPIYGREELNNNQHWYGFTALGLVAGIVISLSLFAFYSIDKGKRDKSGYCAIPIPYLPPPPPVTSHTPHAKGELALGTKVSFIEFKVPKPAPRTETIEGLKKDIKIRDPKGENHQKDWDCELHFPDSVKSQSLPLDKSLFTFDISEIVNMEGEDWHNCSRHYDIHMYEMCQPAPLHDYALKAPVFNQIVDEKPIPINLDEVKKMIRYPKVFCGSGTVVLRIQVDKFGSFSSYKVLAEAHPLLTHEVTKHIDSLRFTPAIWQSKPVASTVNIPFRFQLMK